jgi:hypothetical protein
MQKEASEMKIYPYLDKHIYIYIDTHGVDIGYQNLCPPLHQKQKISHTARCLETAVFMEAIQLCLLLNTPHLFSLTQYKFVLD